MTAGGSGDGTETRRIKRKRGIEELSRELDVVGVLYGEESNGFPSIRSGAIRPDTLERRRGGCWG